MDEKEQGEWNEMKRGHLRWEWEEKGGLERENWIGWGRERGESGEREKKE